MHKQLLPSLGSPRLGLFKKILKRHRSTLAVIWCAIAIVHFNTVMAVAQSANGFGDAMQKVRGNSVLSEAGEAGLSTYMFPFATIGSLLFLSLLVLCLVVIVTLFSGRDVGTPLMIMIGAVAVLLFANQLAGWMASSGLLDGGATAGG